MHYFHTYYISYFYISLWSENTFCMISVPSNLLNFILWLCIWPFLVDIACVLEDVYSPVLVKYSMSEVSGWKCSSLLLLLYFCLIFLSITKNIDISNYNCRYVYFFLSVFLVFFPMLLEALLLDICKFRIIKILLFYWPFTVIKCSSLSLDIALVLKSTVSDTNVATSL